jgi:hypothetical protein
MKKVFLFGVAVRVERICITFMMGLTKQKNTQNFVGNAESLFCGKVGEMRMMQEESHET